MHSDGRNLLDGGPGNDVITSEMLEGFFTNYRGGADIVTAGEGDDEIHTRDLERDTVYCGPGVDEVFADELDTVEGDCEKVTLPYKPPRYVPFDLWKRSDGEPVGVTINGAARYTNDRNVSTGRFGGLARSHRAVEPFPQRDGPALMHERLRTAERRRHRCPGLRQFAADARLFPERGAHVAQIDEHARDTGGDRAGLDPHQHVVLHGHDLRGGDLQPGGLGGGACRGLGCRERRYFERALVRAGLRAAWAARARRVAVRVAPSRERPRAARLGGGRAPFRGAGRSGSSACASTCSMRSTQMNSMSLSRCCGKSSTSCSLQLRRDHALEPGVLRGERLLLEAADRQHLAGQGQLAGHRGVLAHLPARDQRRERGRHRDAGGRPVLRDRTGRHVDVQVMGLEVVLGQILGAELRRVRAHE